MKEEKWYLEMLTKGLLPGLHLISTSPEVPGAPVPHLLHTSMHYRTSLGYWNSLSTNRSQGSTGELNP